jgi:dTDP-4-dehydrorhamnose reductase
MKSILVTGGSGQLGTALARFAWPSGWEAVTIDRATLDLGDTDAIALMVASHPWAAIINAAAYTAVDAAESDIVACWAVNALAPAALAAAADARDIPMVQISTDYVFDGRSQRPWRTDDPVAPINVYGASKLAGELAVRTAAPRHAIVRTAWVVSATGRNFVRTMLRLAAERDVLRVVADQTGTPTMAADLAAAVATIAMRLAEDSQAPAGIWHFANSGPTNWHDFAEAIFAGSARRGGPSAMLEAITTADFPTAARRPAYSVLDTSGIEKDYGIQPRPWRVALEDVLDEIFAKGQP